MLKSKFLVTLIVFSLFLLTSPALADETFEVSLIPCTVGLCGVDGAATLYEGEVEVSDTGMVEVEIERSSLINTTLTLSFLQLLPAGGVEQVLGQFTTNLEGSAETEIGPFDFNAIMGVFYISDTTGTIKYFVTGISTGQGDDYGDCDDDYDCDGIDDYDDYDDDNDGVLNTDDSNPRRYNIFDGVSSRDELKQAYSNATTNEKTKTKTQMSIMKSNLKAKIVKIKEYLTERESDPDL